MRVKIAEGSARAQVRAWIIDTIAGQSEVKVPELADLARQHFSRNAAFMAKLIDEMLGQMVYELARSAISATRGADQVIDLGDAVTTKDNVRLKAIKLTHKWSLFREWVGDRHVIANQMTIENLKAAEGIRGEREGIEGEYRILWRELRIELEKLSPEPECKVGDIYTDDEITELYNQIRDRRAKQVGNSDGNL